MSRIVELTHVESNLLFYALEDRVQEAKRELAKDPADAYKAMLLRQMIFLQRKVM